MKLTISEEEHYTLVRVQEDVTYSNVRDFLRKLDEVIEKDVLDIVLDLEEVPYITSRGLGAIVSTYTILSKRGGTLVVVGPQDEVLNSLSVTKLDQIIPIVADIDQAMGFLKAARASKQAEEEAAE